MSLDKLSSNPRLVEVIKLLKSRDIEIPNVFVETGTRGGGGINAIFSTCDVDRMISFEINELDVIRNRERFGEIIEGGTLEIIHGSSADLLSSHINDIGKSVFFWLDAHAATPKQWKDGYTQEEFRLENKTNYPLQWELDSIINSNIETMIVAIDDIGKFWISKNAFPFNYDDTVSFLKDNNFNIIKCRGEYEIDENNKKSILSHNYLDDDAINAGCHYVLIGHK